MPASLPTSCKSLGKMAFALAALACAGVASPAMAASEPVTKLVRCGAKSCLRISGQRHDTTAVVRINDHAVAVQGTQGWQVHLPVETVRQWSAPFARTIEVALVEPATQRQTIAHVDLPIGMLGVETGMDLVMVSVR